ncbi:MAG: prephenate dehydrogenase [Turicibacter sp.]|nr:prephenate dehydrogenase [Turicibacter sp.]
MNIGIVGLGLIGGSVAKAYKRETGMNVWGTDPSKTTMDFALLAEAIDGELTDAKIGDCDCIILAAYPQAVIDWVNANAHKISEATLVVDCSGTKEKICEALFPVASEHGFTFVGGHPMAGTHNSGFKYSREDLFDGATMVIVPPTFEDASLYKRIETLLAPIGFGEISFTTAAKHDAMIAFTSQMPHLISNGFIKSPTAKAHKGFSAGSYKDLTRVAWLNPSMWSELFLENRDYLLQELEYFESAIHAYKEAIEAGDKVKLAQLLEDGKQAKREVDGRP